MLNHKINSAILAAVIGVLLLTASTRAATYTVDTTADNATSTPCTAAANDCTLRGAINRASDSDTIIFDANVFASAQTITLSRNQLNISVSGSITIRVTGAAPVTVSGNNMSSVFVIAQTANVTIDGLKVTGGTSNIGGGGIYNSGTLTITNSTVSNNSDTTAANSGGDGGGIYNGGSLTLSNSTVSNNSASQQGGGIYNAGTLIVTNSAINNNNSANTIGGGGGIFNLQGRTVNITNSVIHGNVSAGYGGGIENAGILALTNSTVSSNSAVFGGGIDNFRGTVDCTNSTVSKNSANQQGGGIYNELGTINARNAIIAGNAAPSSPDFNGTLTSQGYNLIDNTSGATINGTTTGNILNQNAQLAPLGFYGGTTLTHALLATSPAINAGTSSGAPATDQRSSIRVGAVDIGAFEVNANFVAQLLDGRVSTFYNQTITPDNGAFTYSLASGSSLPPGLTLQTSAPTLAEKPNFQTDAASAIAVARVSVTGTPTIAGTFPFTLNVTDGANSTAIKYSILVAAGPTAANAAVSGRVRTPNGRGLHNAFVTLTDAQGVQRTARTSSFGYFAFNDVAVGETYVADVRSKRFQFSSQVVSVVDNITDLNFTAIDGDGVSP